MPPFPLCHTHFLYTVVHEVVSHPPTQEFMAGSILQMSATPLSKVPGRMAVQQSLPINIPLSQQQQQDRQQDRQPAVSLEPSMISFSGTGSSPLATHSSDSAPQPEKWATPVPRYPSPSPQQRKAQNIGVPMFVQQGEAAHLLGKYQ